VYLDIDNSPMRRGDAALYYVHNQIAELEEVPGRQRLGEEVGEIVRRLDVGHPDLERLDHLANKKMAPLDVLGPLVVLWVVGQIDARLVVHRE